MKLFNSSKIVLVLIGFLATFILSGRSAKADYTFGEPTNLGPIVNSSSTDASMRISPDGLKLFFTSDRPGGSGDWDLWVTTRATTDDDWGEPVNLGATVNSAYREWMPCMSADGLSLYFSSTRPGGPGNYDVWVTTRVTKDDPWAAPVNLGPPVNSSAGEGVATSMPVDGLSLYLSSDRASGYGSFDIWVSTRKTKDDPWAEPVNLGPNVNTGSQEDYPNVSADGLLLFFASDRLGGSGDRDLWVSTRATTDDPWAEPVNLGPTVNTGSAEIQPFMWPDGSTLYFASNLPGGHGGWDIWQAPIITIVDLNDDGIVDSTDMCILVDHWGEDYSLCDIGPMPWGDGIVDVQDLIVLAEHLFTYPGALAYWKLDEAEGDIASDSANDNDGTVYGNPTWQPEGGMLDGALELDGIDDYISTPFVLNPADGKFSLSAWIKGGAPGQAVLSQMGGARWLCADSSDGNLMTELKASARGPTELLSQTIITDGNWHCIGLVWDGLHRTLYVDGVAVAEDEQTNLQGSVYGLYIGTGKAMEPGSYWSGLIDDVRIYNRAVRP